jgi:peptidyl-prolyl cis-trans isomerase C
MISINGRVIAQQAIEREIGQFANAPDPAAAAARALAVRELLLQRAADLGLTGADAPAGRGAEDEVIGRLLDAEVCTPSPTEGECRRYYDTHPERFMAGDLVEARHILFEVKPGTPLAALRALAERSLADLVANPEKFADTATELSNCPSGREGGNLGQFGRGDMVPEFDKAVFGTTSTGILPGLVATRFGFHIISVERRIPGRKVNFDHVRERIATHLSARVQERALSQYVRMLAGRSKIEGVDLDAAASPLLQ